MTSLDNQNYKSEERRGDSSAAANFIVVPNQIRKQNKQSMIDPKTMGGPNKLSKFPKTVNIELRQSNVQSERKRYPQKQLLSHEKKAIPSKIQQGSAKRDSIQKGPKA